MVVSVGWLAGGALVACLAGCVSPTELRADFPSEREPSCEGCADELEVDRAVRIELPPDPVVEPVGRRSWSSYRTHFASTWMVQCEGVPCMIWGPPVDDAERGDRTRVSAVPLAPGTVTFVLTHQNERGQRFTRRLGPFTAVEAPTPTVAPRFACEVESPAGPVACRETLLAGELVRFRTSGYAAALHQRIFTIDRQRVRCAPADDSCTIEVRFPAGTHVVSALGDERTYEVVP